MATSTSFHQDDAGKEDGDLEEGQRGEGDEEKENEEANVGEKRRKVVDGAGDRKRSRRESELADEVTPLTIHPLMTSLSLQVIV